MTELRQIDNSCEDQAPCESIRDSRCSRRRRRCVCVTTNVLWPEPLPVRVPRCETWKWSPFTTFSAARLTWSLGSRPSLKSTTVKRETLRLFLALGLLCSMNTTCGRFHHYAITFSLMLSLPEGARDMSPSNKYS
jgi:hypothetical protein